MLELVIDILISLIVWPILAFGPNYTGANSYTVLAFVYGMLSGAGVSLSIVRYVLKTRRPR